MTHKIEIDFVSDIACPWCVIGLYGLEQALERLKDEVEVEIRFQPFELDPSMPPGGVNKVENLMRKYGRTREQAVEARQMVAARAAGVGFDMSAGDDDRAYNTFDAHRLMHWAELAGRQQAMKHALFDAYFTRNEDVADPEVLARAAEAAGLDAGEAREILASDRFGEEVRAAQTRWRMAGISSVPSVVVDNRYLISGGQPAEAFEQALRSIAAEKAAS